MIIYISMLIVVFVGWCIQNIYAEKNGIQVRTSKLAVFLTFGYIIFWTGIRNAFVDTAAYIVKFSRSQWSDLYYLEYSFDSGWGFDVLMIVFKTIISDNYHAWLMFLAIISGGCIAVVFWKYSINYYYTLFMFLAMTSFTWLMNGIRQFLAVTIIFTCIPLIEKKKWLIYCFIVLLCTTIHASCIIMIPIYFIVQGEPWKKKTIVIMLGTCLGLMFASRFTTVMDAILEETKWATMTEDYLNDDGVNPLRVAVYSIPAVMAFIGRKNLKNVPLYIDIFTNMSICTVVLYAIGMVTNGIMIGRLPMYIQMYGYVLLPYTIEQCFTEKSKRMIYVFSIGCYLFYFYLMSKGFYYSSDFTGRIY